MVNLELQLRLDDVASLRMAMYPKFSRFILESGKALPKNEPAPGTQEPDLVLRKLDCAVVNWSLSKAGRDYQTSGAFLWKAAPPIPAAESC